jgi:hypothetical protein
MEFLNDVWMNTYNPHEFFQTIIFMLIIFGLYLIIVPNNKKLNKLWRIY